MAAPLSRQHLFQFAYFNAGETLWFKSVGLSISCGTDAKPRRTLKRTIGLHVLRGTLADIC